LNEWIENPGRFGVQKTHLGESMLPTYFLPDISLILEKLRVIRAGLLPGQFAGKDFIPNHDLALSLEVSDKLPVLELDRNQALRFLKKETEGIPHPGKGWFMVRYEGLGLGWIKAVPGRINNYLPKHFRILKEIKANDIHYL
jgi:NOL1/NOP2/fmu family ribosome biogenesis protein